MKTEEVIDIVNDRDQFICRIEIFLGFFVSLSCTCRQIEERDADGSTCLY
jgi:hypothetical protein